MKAKPTGGTLKPASQGDNSKPGSKGGKGGKGGKSGKGC